MQVGQNVVNFYKVVGKLPQILSVFCFVQHGGSRKASGMRDGLQPQVPGLPEENRTLAMVKTIKEISNNMLVSKLAHIWTSPNEFRVPRIRRTVTK